MTWVINYGNAEDAYSQMNTQQVQAFTFQTDPINITATYSRNTYMTFTPDVEAGQLFNWTMAVYGGTLSVSLSAPEGSTFSQSFPVPVGSQQTVQATGLPAGLGGLDIFVNNTLSAVPNIDGLATLLTKNVTWSSEGPQT